MSGFTYNGFDSKTIGVYVNPDAAARWFESPVFEQKSEEGTWRHGGYYYGTRVKTRTLSFTCWFENITMRDRERIRWWLSRDTSGYLIFDDRPFVKYKVRPAGITNGQIYGTQGYGESTRLYSGTFTVSFTAYDPFGYLIYTSYDSNNGQDAIPYCNIISTSEMPDMPTTSSREFLIYNPGTEKCAVSFEIGGAAANGMTITNATNGTKCVLKGLPTSGTLIINGETGVITNLSEYAFEFHDHGFVKLDPCLTLYDHMWATYSGGLKVVHVSRMTGISDGMIDKYIRIGNNWVRIIGVTSPECSYDSIMNSQELFALTPFANSVSSDIKTLKQYQNSISPGSSAAIQLRTEMDYIMAQAIVLAGDPGSIKKDDLGDLIEHYFPSANMDLLNRPIIPSTVMNAKGWNTEAGSISTYFSQTYTAGASSMQGKTWNHNVFIHATPIRDDGIVLTPTQLNDYIDELLDATDDVDSLMVMDSENQKLLIGVLTGYDSLSAGIGKSDTMMELLHILGWKYYFYEEPDGYYDADSNRDLIIKTAMTTSDTTSAWIADMNRIVITGDNISLNVLDYWYEPRIL